ncbi:MAG: PhoH family protein [Fusobacteria bacterium]|nr:PhoH family protein [Fusobacteriota bacterium]
MIKEKRIEINSYEDIKVLFGQQDQNKDLIEAELAVELEIRDNNIIIKGFEDNVHKTGLLLEYLLIQISNSKELDFRRVEYIIEELMNQELEILFKGELFENLAVTYDNKIIRAKSFGQKYYINAIKNNDVVFALGPAGTGKTFLGVLMAVEALKKREIKKIILVRPAVEAGEQLGFLPGDLQEKIQPYIKPLYDSLHYLLGVEQVDKYIEKKIIEIAPLAYMRGRTLDDAYIILDEGQNTTIDQMKMFLTRFGNNSKIIVTGDPSQNDLKKDEISGLIHSTSILSDIKGIKVIYLKNKDIVRHRLVRKIIEAYEERR